ncbi:family 1 glycosylhydrolase [Gloeobacter kilaueensis]|uniref:6-phospho-beta-galactosidase n=1 Tax=Gloeobacter kilaueensis (strain ATCC BAA-2537 / CCAP 1431/1 / ULC 316 / JS1) TaxID=1183438 RepID=U5QKP1_GLOK1|nr:family 1 glycosylhydrolase [Gloeobacter kilaueensis]AGY58184.1 6-phospho-beta-galactosidase [Gloeobacter kilaueensis JS1]
MHSDASSFLWGVATSGYQSEGGYNAPGQPQNNWSESERAGTVMRTGRAAEFWQRYEEDFQTCRALGLNAFRLGWEWARIQPGTGTGTTRAPDFDPAALAAYARRLAACRQAGLEPIVTLHHFTHPAWLGLDAWLDPATVDCFVAYVRTSVEQINRLLIEQHGLPPVRWYITVNEPNILALNTYLSRQFPAGAHWGPAAVLRAYNHLLAAHLRAYNCIHDIYEAQGWPTPRVSLNTLCSDLYWSEKVIWDLLSLRERQIKPGRLAEYFCEKAQALDTALAAARLPFRRDLPYRAGRLARRLASGLARPFFNSDSLDFWLGELERSPRSGLFDFVATDYYDPFFAHTFRLPVFSDFEFTTRSPHAWLVSGITSKWWDWRCLAEGLHFFCQYYAEDLGNCPVLIAENGMALRRKPDNSVASRRPDQISRSQFLVAHIEQVMRLRAEGVPLVGYLHWSLTDNYEWGSFTPRFGLFAIDFAAGGERLLQDHLGDRPAQTYARLVREARNSTRQS